MGKLSFATLVVPIHRIIERKMTGKGLLLLITLRQHFYNKLENEETIRKLLKTTLTSLQERLN